MHRTRTLLAATTLANGDVLAVSGYSNADGLLTSSERYDLATGTWTLGDGAMRRGRIDGTATLLADGRVLVAGGADLQRTLPDGELYDPESTTFEWVHSAGSARTLGHTAHRIADERVLVVGGWHAEASRVLSECDVYDSDIDGGPPPEEPDAEAPDAGADANARDAGRRDAAGDADADGSGGPGPGDPSFVDGPFGATGGCTTTASPDDTWPLAVLGAVAWMAARRRRAGT